MTATQPEMVEVRLQSDSMVNAAGILRWAMNGYKFKRDRKKMANVIAQTWNLKDEIAHGLLSGKIAHKTEGEDVIFQAEKGSYKRS